jgi:D-tyrosyl-tRNA(Tyr) deacylase
MRVIALIQRVSEAAVRVDDEIVGAIDRGLLALVAVQPTDGPAEVEKLAERLVRYRVFADDRGKMNLCLQEIAGGLLLVSQFTLAADTRSGLRPSFSHAAPPAQAEALFAALVRSCRGRLSRVETGRFGADMKIALVNDGPVTFWLQT